MDIWYIMDIWFFFLPENTHSPHKHTHIALFPYGLCETVTVTVTIASVPAVEQSSVIEKQQQMLRSQLQDYLSLSKLHYCLYYPGIHSLRKSTLQSHCLPSTLLPRTQFPFAAKQGRSEDQRGEEWEKVAWVETLSVFVSARGGCNSKSWSSKWEKIIKMNCLFW